MTHRRVIAASLFTVAAAVAARGQTPPGATPVALPEVSVPRMVHEGGGDDTPAPSADDALLGAEFNNRTEGFRFRPPVGGTQLRQLNSGEIVRFSYPDRAWTVRLKVAKNDARLPMATDPRFPDHQGLLDATAKQLTDGAGVPATLLRKEMIPLGPRRAGLIEARDNAGINRVFTQVALIPDGTSRYFILQMVSPGAEEKPKGVLDPTGLAREREAKDIFQRTLATVTVATSAERQQLRDEQNRRIWNARNLWVQLDRKRVMAALEPPVRFLRVIRDGKDVGYVQINQRLEQHHGQDGFAIIARSHMEMPVEAPAVAPAPAVAAAGSVVDLPRPGAAAAPAGVQQLDRDARFFCTFDRAHEDWTITGRANNVAGNDAVEMGNSDVEVHPAINAAAAQAQVRLGAAGGGAPVPNREVQTLLVDNYRGNNRVGATFEQRLDYRYLPAAFGQLLPQLVPVDEPQKYLYAFYVSEQRAILFRYVDVGQEREVTLDDRTVRAVPITDRIGADGIATIHYVRKADGQWLGTVGDDGKLVVLPADEETLGRIWPKFTPLKEPPPPVDDDVASAARHPARHKPSADDGSSPLPPALNPGSIFNR
jgi:hypothetical protein